MHSATLGPFGPVSRLTLGGGGIGELWGQTNSVEAGATLKAAIDGGIDLIDAAPGYRHCETLIGETFAGKPPAGVRFTSKCQLGSPPRGETAARLTASLEASLSAMRLERLDLFFLHSNLCPDDYVYARAADRQDSFATRWSIYVEEVIPALRALVVAGKIAHWGITGIGVPATVLDALRLENKPTAVQAIANLLDSAGGIKQFGEPEQPRAIIAEAQAQGVGVMGIRAVQAGALCDVIDRPLSPRHPEVRDYEKAAAFRALAAQMRETPARLAHRYALAMAGVDTVVLGVKNRTELNECLEAEASPLEPEAVARIDALNLR